MGNPKFKLSNIIPNSWLPKLKSKPPSTTTEKPKHHRIPPPTTTTKTTTSPLPPLPLFSNDIKSRKSYHFTRDLPLQTPISPPRKSKTSPKHKKPTKKTTINKSQELSKLPHNPKNTPPKDIVIDFENLKYNNPSYKLDGLDFQLPKIITKPTLSTHEVKRVEPDLARRFSVSSPGGVRLRINSPRIMGMKQQGQNRNYGGHRRSLRKKQRNITQSFAVVKSSKDPQSDFRESMVEMIVQNKLKGAKDLEDLLACYLSLNSDEYHDVIIKVFKQIWYDLSEFKLRKLVS